jgi:hypothetical protein
MMRAVSGSREMSAQTTPPARTPSRLSFPEDDEARLPWLALLLEGYAIAGEGVAEGIRRGQAQGRQPACHRGCAACCRTHRDIPVYPLELMGLYWYAIEKLGGETCAKLREQLQSYRRGDACPFLRPQVIAAVEQASVQDGEDGEGA